MNVEDLAWHDGNIHKLEFSPGVNGLAEVVILADLYEDSVQSSDRSRIKIQCSGVREFRCLADIADNARAGSISMGYLKGGKLYIHLFGGLIEVSAVAFECGVC